MKVAFTRGAWREWQRLPQSVRARLKKKIMDYAVNPVRHAVKLSDERIGQYRFRIGSYRVVFDIVGGELTIIAVGHRKGIYR